MLWTNKNEAPLVTPLEKTSNHIYTDTDRHQCAVLYTYMLAHCIAFDIICFLLSNESIDVALGEPFEVMAPITVEYYALCDGVWKQDTCASSGTGLRKPESSVWENYFGSGDNSMLFLVGYIYTTRNFTPNDG